MPHIPVLLQECLNVLDPKPGEVFADGTLGGGGHAREIFAKIVPGGTLLAVDRDPRAVELAAKTFEPSAKSRLLIEAASYSEIPALMKKFEIEKLDGLLLDLGFSSEQIIGGTLAGRGFSFMTDEPLLMTYDEKTKSLAALLAELSEDDLASIIEQYGEERFAKQIAKSIVQKTRKEGIATTGQLVSAIKEAVPANYEQGRIHPATRTFQALRIYANGELRELEIILAALPKIMAKGGRVAIISFHSLEDRIVKQHFQAFARSGGRSAKYEKFSRMPGEAPNSATAPDLGAARQVDLLTKKPITSTEKELFKNPRSRSAKLRAIRFL
jgi:16S rRNA (cytosine1402-N4)-methyltransferase